MTEEQKEYEKNPTIYERALIKSGVDRQIDKLIEEMSEFAVALMHYKYGRENNVPQEFADVTTVMKQLRPIFNKYGDVDTWDDLTKKNLEKLL